MFTNKRMNESICTVELHTFKTSVLKAVKGILGNEILNIKVPL